MIGSAGLVPMLGLADSAGLRRLAQERLSVPTDEGANAELKVVSLVAGMCAGADSNDDMALLRHGGMGRGFEGRTHRRRWARSCERSPFGHLHQLDAVAARFLTALSQRAPLLPGDEAGRHVLVDVDNTIIEVHGYAKQRAGFGTPGCEG